MTNVQELLGLSKPPVAIGFLDSPPAGVGAWSDGPVPAGCFFWKKAQEGQTFYTIPSDHYNCAVGAYTHNIALPEERSGELEQTVGFMVGNGYIRMEEVPGIPTLPATPAVIAYAPVDSAPFVPSVVVIAAQPALAMLLYEAVLRAGAGTALINTLGRPGCAVLPLSLQTGAATFSLGCKGNRTFTGLPDEEMYLSIPGNQWAAVVEQVARIHQANQAMGDYYNQHKGQFSVS
jgi:uncharacterized protein (DUF169 family)